MKFVLNKEIVVLDKNGGSLILHNKALDKLYEISEEELECLQDYASETHESFKLLLLEKNYEENSITEISHFIEMAKENQILVEENYHYFLNRNLPKILYYLIVFFPFLEFIFIYNNKIFKIFEFKKFNFTIQLLTLFLFFICFAFSMYLMRDLVEYTSMIKVWILVLFISCSSIFHELGHLVSYKLLGGKSEKWDLDLCTIFTLYYTLVHPHYIFGITPMKRKKKIWVSISGSLFDLQTMIIMGMFNNYLGLYLIMFRIIQNLNPFIPFSDGYFLLKDIKGKIVFEKLLNQSNEYLQSIKIHTKNVFNKNIISFVMLNIIRFIILAIYLIFIYKFLIKELSYYFILN